jgi:2'-5' RNA ligase
MIRLFCAIELPISLRDRLIALGGGLPGARWVSEENLHLTLNFIGEVPESSFDDIGAALSGVGVPVFELVVKGMGHFERSRKPIMLWAGVEPNPQLTHLHDRIVSSLRRVGVKGDGHQFLPHITLARFDDHLAPERVADFLRANGLFRAPPFTVEQFVLFSSVLGHAGPTYRAEAEFPLEGALGLSDEDFRA